MLTQIFEINILKKSSSLSEDSYMMRRSTRNNLTKEEKTIQA